MGQEKERNGNCKFSERDSLLSRTECNALRGVAIIGIFLHNFSHWLKPIVKENEYSYTQKNVDDLWFVLTHPDSNFPLHVISFFGHYGVPVFLFLSGYGLYQKYERMNDEGTIGTPFEFIKKHYLKLFRMMYIGVTCFALVAVLYSKYDHVFNKAIIPQLLLVGNLLPYPQYVGPYWYFGLMLQIYIIYGLFFYKANVKLIVGTILLCTFAQAFCAPDSFLLEIFRNNFIGSILPFGLGLLYARYGQSISPGTNTLVMFVSLILIVAFSFNFYTWLLVPFFICTLSVSLIKIISNCKLFLESLSWFGGISAALFVSHPIIRSVIIDYGRQGFLYQSLMVYIIVAIGFAYLFQRILK